jgi:hypothetical protein
MEVPLLSKIIDIKPVTDEQHQEKMPLEGEVRERMSWISPEYLGGAVTMTAWQFIDEFESTGEEPKDLIAFSAKAADTLRYHCPIAYSYMFENNQQDWPLPVGSLDLILKAIRREVPTFMGGVHGDHNFFD